MNLAKIIAKKLFSESLEAFQIERYIFLAIFTEKSRVPHPYKMNPDPGPGPVFFITKIYTFKKCSF
jgi:hypothetical protein